MNYSYSDFFSASLELGSLEHTAAAATSNLQQMQPADEHSQEYERVKSKKANFWRPRLKGACCILSYTKFSVTTPEFLVFPVKSDVVAWLSYIYVDWRCSLCFLVCNSTKYCCTKLIQVQSCTSAVAAASNIDFNRQKQVPGAGTPENDTDCCTMYNIRPTCKNDSTELQRFGDKITRS